MRKLVTEKELIEILATNNTIVLDQAQKQWNIFDEDSEQEVIDLSIELFKKIEDLVTYKVITRDIFITTRTNMLISYAKWPEQDAKMSKTIIEAGLEAINIQPGSY